MRRWLMVVPFSLLMAASLACAGGAGASTATSSAPPPETALPLTPPQIETASGDDQTLLTRRQGIPGHDCGAITVTTSYRLTVGPCDGPAVRSSAIEQADSLLLLQWASTHLAPFEDLQTDGSGLVFTGTGGDTDPAWQHAVANWAESAYAQETSGHVCSACQTALSWTIGPSADDASSCRRLTVLSFGVGYAQTGPCDGANWTVIKRALVRSGDWDSFDSWLHLYVSYSEGPNSFGGVGSQPLTASVAPGLDNWAKAVYDEVLASGPVP